jgi:Trk K+ transport system NAD-binding subunit
MKSIVHPTPRVCVAGAGRFGRALAQELKRRGSYITVVDRDPKALERLNGVADRRLLADIAEKSEMAKLNLSSYDAICLTMGREMLPSIHFCFCAGPEMTGRIYCRPAHDLHRKILGLAGVKNLLEVEQSAAEELGRQIEESTRSTGCEEDGNGC